MLLENVFKKIKQTNFEMKEIDNQIIKIQI